MLQGTAGVAGVQQFTRCWSYALILDVLVCLKAMHSGR